MSNVYAAKKIIHFKVKRNTVRAEICSSLPRLAHCGHGRLPRLSPSIVQYGLDAARELRGGTRQKRETGRLGVRQT